MLSILDRGELVQGTILTLGKQKYRIIKLLGLGTSCIVYKAQVTICIDDKTLERTVVLKELYPKGLGIGRKTDNSLEIPENSRKIFDEYINHFKKSCERQIAFHNDEKIANSTTEIQQIYITNNTMYSIMGIVTGNSYDNVNPNDIESILNVGMSLADCISTYHEKGYLHLDIKPANIFNADLPGDNVAIQLFDFDSVSTKEEILSGNLSYSVEYAAPEVKAVKSSNGKLSAIDEKADLFSIGSVIFEKIMGRRSKAEDHSNGKSWDFSNNPYLRNTVPQLQKGIADLFRKTLARNTNKRYSSAKELSKALEKLIKLAKIDVFLKNQNISPCTAKNIYIPRRNACDTIYERLNQYHILYLYAIRGSGKSETAREYAEINADKYNFIQLAFYSQNLKKTIANLDFIGLKFEDKIAQTDEDIDRLYLYKLNLLGNTDIYTSNTLLIIDNYDYDSNPESEEYIQNVKVLSDLKKLHIHIIFTTRVNPNDKIHCFNLEDMSKEELKQLFFKINPVQKDDSERIRLVEEIINASYNHTMTVKLIALQSKKYKKSLEEYLSVMKENGLNSHIQGRITNEKDDESITMSAVYDHIKALFDFDDLSDKEKYIMVNACLLPLEGLDIVTFSNFIDLDNFDHSSSDCIDESIGNLVNSGWIIYANIDETQISIHNLIFDIVINELKPELTESKCKKFYVSFLDLISEWGNSKINKMPNYRLKQNMIYLIFPKIIKVFFINSFINYMVIDYINTNDEDFFIEDYMLIKKDKLLHYFGVEEICEIPNNISSIGDSAFAFCNSIKKVVIPDGVREIGNGAFLDANQ